MKNPAVYIMTNKRNGALYTGVTSNLIQRIFQHKNKLAKKTVKLQNLRVNRGIDFAGLVKVNKQQLLPSRQKQTHLE